MKKITAFLIIAILVCFMNGCNIREDTVMIPVNNQMPGGIVDNSNINAPKEIESDKLVSFSCSYFLYGSVTGESDSGYSINVKKDNEGKLILTEAGHKVSCETDEAFLQGIQEIIVQNNLASINGVNKHTSGLPFMFQPCYFDAVYDSGEELHFSIDNNPESAWGRDIYKLTKKEFKKHGIDAFNPPADAGKITKFILTYTDGDMYHHFSEMEVPVAGVKKSLMELAEEGYKEGESEVKIQYLAWNRATNERSTSMGTPTDEYYEGLDEIISQIDLSDFANISGAPYSFNYKDTPDYFEYYIEYDNGKVLRGFSDASDRCVMFAPIAQKFTDYIKGYTDFN